MGDKIKAGRENKPHIGIFGRPNAGKSTLLNFIVGGEVAIVSPVAGTTTDVVRKSYEIPGFAPVIFMDTAGVGDGSPLASARLERTMEALGQVDMAILVFTEWSEEEARLMALLREAAIPVVTVRNMIGNGSAGRERDGKEAEIFSVAVKNGYPVRTDNTEDDEAVRAIDAEKADKPGHRVNNEAAGPDDKRDGKGTADLALDISRAGADAHSAIIELIRNNLPEDSYTAVGMLPHTVGAGDTILLVCPIDSEAPAGRMILPQMQAVRETLDRRAIALVVQPSELSAALSVCPSPGLVVCDSQVYKEVRAVVPSESEVTTFSILLAASKGDMDIYMRGLESIDSLEDGSRILVAESCSHQVSCDDIGRVKIPAWLTAYTGKRLEFGFVPGLTPLPRDLSSYSLMVQCGGCMVTRRALRNRIRSAVTAGVPVTNYGLLIKKIR